MALTRKQQRFVEEYTVDFNATQAAIRAGYSERTARQQGHRLLTKANISQSVQERVDELAMSADEALIRLADMGRGDMGDFMDIESMSFSINLAKAKELGLTHLIRKVKDRVVMTSNKDGEETETHTLEIELYDAKDAIDKILRAHGTYKDTLDLNVRSYDVQFTDDE